MAKDLTGKIIHLSRGFDAGIMGIGSYATGFLDSNGKIYSLFFDSHPPCLEGDTVKLKVFRPLFHPSKTLEMNSLMGYRYIDQNGKKVPRRYVESVENLSRDKDRPIPELSIDEYFKTFIENTPYHEKPFG